MSSVRFTAETSSNGIVERDFTVDEIPGVLWSPLSGAAHAPLVLLGHGGGLHKKTPAQVARAHHYVTAHGYTVVAIDAPGHGVRPRTAVDERTRADLREAMTAGAAERFKSVSARYGTMLAERAVPEWRATLDALQELPEIGTEAPVGYGGGISLGTAIGIPLTAAEPRIAAAIFGGGFVVDAAMIGTARRIAVPVQFLLPWDDEYVDRQSALALFDAFASEEKTLHANPGDHRDVRWYGVDDEFLARHLGRAGASAETLEGSPAAVSDRA
jgi:pimeloyl-ACP methyl ester carboxylesterase